MDDTTRAVRQQYEAYPYPSGPVTMRTSADVRLLLSYVERGRAAPGPLRALDAGCGRARGLIASAALQPDVGFVGVDINRVGLDEARDEVARRNLRNVELNEVDLMTLDGLTPPPGGFDVIYSSGVLHHLTDPELGLRRLAASLAPHGALVVMVYARHGREPLARIARALNIVAPPRAPVADRIGPARAVADAMRDGVLKHTPWEACADVDDVELVDRVLNANETSYDVAGLWALAEQAGLRFVRWSDPGQWAAGCLPSASLRAAAAGLREYERFRLVEQVCWRTAFEVVLGHRDNAPRAALDPAAIDSTLFAVSPEIAFVQQTRNPRGTQRLERLELRLRSDDPVAVRPELAPAVCILRDQNQPFTGDTLVAALVADAVAEADARAAIVELVDRDVLYRPHPTEL